MTERNGKLQVSWQSSVDAVARAIAPSLGSLEGAPVALVPSTLSSTSQDVSTLRSSLRSCGVRTRVLLPRSLMSIALGRRSGEMWRTIQVEGRSFRVDGRLQRPYVATVLVDNGHMAGPFVIDLPSRFLHPVDRARLVAMPERLRHLADIAAPVSPTLCVVLTPVGDGWLSIVARDAIAAELWALGLAERYLDRRLEMQGPWEDPTVQRATELEMGVRVPQEMTLAIDPTERLEPAARELLERTATRLGMMYRDT